MKIAFIGLGNMGGSMAQNLLKSDHQAFGYDLSETALQHFAQAGGVVCDSPAAAKQAEVVVSMLPAAKHVREVYLGEHGILEALQPGSYVSTAVPLTRKPFGILPQQRRSNRFASATYRYPAVRWVPKTAL